VGFIAFVVFLVGINTVISLCLAVFIRSTGLCIFASWVITELLIALPLAVGAMYSRHPEDLLLVVSAVMIYGTPILICSSVGTVFFARRLYRRSKA
jgi:hypothetical protein